MITTKCDNTWMMLSVDRNWNEGLAGKRIVAKRGESRSVKELLVPAFDLLDGILVVVRCDWDVTTVYKFKPREERVNVKGDVVSSIQSQPAGPCTDASRPETSTRSVGRPGILRSNDQLNLVSEQETQ
jgi:hypothetical protein